MPATIHQPPVRTPQHRPELPPANWPVIDAWLAEHGLPAWIG